VAKKLIPYKAKKPTPYKITPELLSDVELFRDVDDRLHGGMGPYLRELEEESYESRMSPGNRAKSQIDRKETERKAEVALQKLYENHPELPELERTSKAPVDRGPSTYDKNLIRPDLVDKATKAASLNKKYEGRKVPWLTKGRMDRVLQFLEDQEMIETPEQLEGPPSERRKKEGAFHLKTSGTRKTDKYYQTLDRFLDPSNDLRSIAPPDEALPDEDTFIPPPHRTFDAKFKREIEYAVGVVDWLDPHAFRILKSISENIKTRNPIPVSETDMLFEHMSSSKELSNVSEDNVLSFAGLDIIEDLKVYSKYFRDRLNDAFDGAYADVIITPTRMQDIQQYLLDSGKATVNDTKDFVKTETFYDPIVALDYDRQRDIENLSPFDPSKRKEKIAEYRKEGLETPKEIESKKTAIDFVDKVPTPEGFPKLRGKDLFIEVAPEWLPDVPKESKTKGSPLLDFKSKEDKVSAKANKGGLNWNTLYKVGYYLKKAVRSPTLLTLLQIIAETSITDEHKITLNKLWEEFNEVPEDTLWDKFRYRMTEKDDLYSLIPDDVKSQVKQAEKELSEFDIHGGGDLPPTIYRKTPKEISSPFEMDKKVLDRYKEFGKTEGIESKPEKTNLPTEDTVSFDRLKNSLKDKPPTKDDN
jgi:hypothetical protein